MSWAQWHKNNIAEGEEWEGQHPSICFKSLLPKKFGPRRPQLKDSADQTFSLIKWGRSRRQVKFTEYIQSSSERKKINKLYVFFFSTPVSLPAQSRLDIEQVFATGHKN